MRSSAFKNRNIRELALPLLVFGALVVLTYGIFFQMPYSGFFFNPSDGRVLSIYEQGDPVDGLKVGDVLKQIGPVTWDMYFKNGGQTLFDGVQPGQIIDITVERDGQAEPVTMHWRFPGFNDAEFASRLINVWWLAYIFWAFGAAMQLFVRPKDLRWRFLLAANYLTALWLMTGCLSAWRVWESSLSLHALTWLALPIYIGLHWNFPKPLASGSRWTWAWGLLCLFCGILAVEEIFSVLPRTLYLIGFVLTFAGSLVLLFLHLVWQPAQRREVVILLIAFLLALTPALSLVLVEVFLGSLPPIGSATFVALPIMPIAYFYSVYRNQLGGLELRANRIISVYAFLSLVLALIIPLTIPFGSITVTAETSLFITIAASALTALVAALAFPSFQTQFERRVLGIRLANENLQEVYATRITTSPSLPSLDTLLRDEVLPSLFVRQFVFLQFQEGQLGPLLRVGVAPEQVPGGRELETLLPWLGRYRPPEPSESESPLAWVRLVLPLQVEDALLGYWLFGRRDPDDHYPQAEIPMLQSLANQTSIALSNILQAARLRSMYQANIGRNERERLRLAHELHDNVLNEMAVLLFSPDAEALPEGFKQGYARLTQRMREIASELRPPMFNYGLKPALVEMADNLMERSQDTVNIQVDVQGGEKRYPEDVENNLYRILQQGLENAMRHGQAESIRLYGRMDQDGVELFLEDDGSGFNTPTRPDLGRLLEKKHFGLAGMYERAALIQARIEIVSMVGNGTRITLAWKAPPTTPEIS
jgi:signal transduction histidine kinase